jgi:hypothetical protein
LALSSGLAFDARGSLWVTASASNNVLGFTASQLAASGAPTPLTLGPGYANQFKNPGSITFDPYLPVGADGMGVHRQLCNSGRGDQNH